ncbi:hypothetical protein [Metamycoplasma equirhinis]|uniref:hypothetical protein n=1 Tax=Metamycoplasma equirhinis TaxID=92402 RepID=UPI003593EB55
MSNRKFMIKKLLFTVGFIMPITLTPTLSAACNIRPEITFTENTQNLYKTKGYHVVGSAKDFNYANHAVSNPRAEEDPRYYIFQKDEHGNLIKRNDFPVVNAETIKEGYKPIFKEIFQFLNIKNINEKYDYRIFSFTWKEFAENFSYAASKPRYKKYKDNPRALFVVCYWVLKLNEAAPNFKEAAQIDKTVSHFLTKSGNPEVTGDILEEAPWPFFPGILPGKNKFWKDVTDPIVVLFSED